MRVAIPHRLDRAEVRRRLTTRTGELAGFIPGGMAKVDHDWLGEDRMQLSIGAMGQSVTAVLDVEDNQVMVTIDLPPQLSFFESTIAGAIRDKGTKLLR